MSKQTHSTGLAATLTLSRLAWRRLFRGKLIWLSLAMCALPVPLAYIGAAATTATPSTWRTVYSLLLVLVAIVPALHLAPAVAEEIEDKTYTYLWSRPLPRWSLIAGKLLALAPATAFLLGVTAAGACALTLGSSIGEYPMAPVCAAVGTALGALAASCACMGVGSLMASHATITAILYLGAVDLPVSYIPFSIQYLSFNFHMRQIALAQELFSSEALVAMLWLVGLAGIWLALALWKVARAEPAGGGR